MDTFQCIFSDALQQFWFYRDRFQIFRPAKCTGTNLGYFISDRNFLQLLAALECILLIRVTLLGNAVDLNGLGNVYRSHFLICCNNCCCLLLCVQDLISDLIQNSLVHSRFSGSPGFSVGLFGRFFRWFFCWFFGRFFRLAFRSVFPFPILLSSILLLHPVKRSAGSAAPLLLHLLWHLQRFHMLF